MARAGEEFCNSKKANELTEIDIIIIGDRNNK